MPDIDFRVPAEPAADDNPGADGEIGIAAVELERAGSVGEEIGVISNLTVDMTHEAHRMAGFRIPDDKADRREKYRTAKTAMVMMVRRTGRGTAAAGAGNRGHET